MKTRYTVALALLAGVAIGALAVQGLHAQGAKTAYSISELTILSRDAERAYVVEARNTIGGNQGRPLRTTNGRIEKIEGGEPPRVWPSSSGLASRPRRNSINQTPGPSYSPSGTKRTN